MPQYVKSEEALPPLPIYSQAVVSNGLVFAAGNIGITADFKLVDGGIKGQTRAALENLGKVLKAANSGFEHVVKVNIYITDFADFAALNEVYSEFWEKDKFPARTCVGVASLPLGACVEIECTAEVVKA